MTMQRQALDITGYRGMPVPTVFWRQDVAADHLAVILPGLQYTCDMPLLYYPISHLLDLGADVLQVEYAYGRRADYAAGAADEQERWLAADVGAAWQAVTSQHVYPRLTLVGKSLGTRVMRQLLATETMPDDTRLVWLTPLLSERPVREAVCAARRPTLVVIGDADPHYDAAVLATVQTAVQGEVLVIPGADHGLEITGNVVGSVQALVQVVAALQRLTA
jgi:predicted alpha/beta-hydrolase family hydrolase